MDLSDVRTKFLTIMSTYRNCKPHVAVAFDFERKEWIAAALPLSGKANNPDGAFRELIHSAIAQCKSHIQDHKDQIAFEESMIGELEGLL